MDKKIEKILSNKTVFVIIGFISLALGLITYFIDTPLSGISPVYIIGGIVLIFLGWFI